MHSKFLLYECFAMHMMTCQVLMLGQNTIGVTPFTLPKPPSTSSDPHHLWLDKRLGDYTNNFGELPNSAPFPSVSTFG